MKTVLVLLFIFGAAFAAPAEEPKKAPEAPVVKEEEAAAPEVNNEMMMTEEELPVSEDSVPEPSARFSFCPDGWFSHDFRCFMLVNTPMTWHNAEDHCRSLGGHLASATSSREYTFLQELTKTAGQSFAWLGGFNLQGRWMWIEPTGFYYTNWYSQNTVSSNPCIYLRSTTGWRNLACSTSYRFICSRNQFGC